MASDSRGWRLDVTCTADEILVLLARHGSVAARDELQLRAQKYVAAWIASLCRRHQLIAADHDDLKQQLFFYTQQAIAAFDAEELAKPDGCVFQTFLRRVVQRRVQDFARESRRYRRRFSTSLDDARVGKMGGARGIDNPTATHQRRSTEGDPAQVAAERELMARLAEAVARLATSQPSFYTARQDGATLQDLAHRFRVSTRTVKRRWHEIVTSLRNELHSFVD